MVHVPSRLETRICKGTTGYVILTSQELGDCILMISDQLIWNENKDSGNKNRPADSNSRIKGTAAVGSSIPLQMAVATGQSMPTSIPDMVPGIQGLSTQWRAMGLMDHSVLEEGCGRWVAYWGVVANSRYGVSSSMANQRAGGTYKPGQSIDLPLITSWEPQPHH
ncbi:MAG: hypothetical protein DSY87_09675 [Methylococcus sp.]|nr:MAG: hypothetical protein DSY87_09675 [Methylococcus sp.]